MVEALTDSSCDDDSSSSSSSHEDDDVANSYADDDNDSIIADDRKVLVTNLPIGVGREEMDDFFGSIEQGCVRIVNFLHNLNGQSIRRCIVTFWRASYVDEALGYNGRILDYKPVYITRFNRDDHDHNDAQAAMGDNLYPIRVQHLNPVLSHAELAERLDCLFGHCGEYVHLRFQPDYRSGMITFRTMEGQQNASILDGTMLDGLSLSITEMPAIPYRTFL